MIGLSSLMMATVTSSGGVATDDVTNLQWQDDASIATTKDWQEAITYCNTLNLGDKEDWRLPNKNELISIVDYAKSTDVFLDGFEQVSNGTFWSSTTSAVDAGTAWNVNFGAGYVDNGNKTYDYSVRCVRGGL